MKTKNLEDYPLIYLLEEVNLKSKDRIDLKEVLETEKEIERNIEILGFNSDDFFKIQDNKICLSDDLNRYGTECRSEGFINGYITALKIIKGEIL